MAQLQLDWPANPTQELVSHYEVFEQFNDFVWNLKATVSEPQYVFTPAPAQARWRVRAVNFVGVSEFSPVAEGPTVPSAPGILTVTVVP